MVLIVDPGANGSRIPSLAQYDAHAALHAKVSDLKAEASLIAPRFEGRTLWMINSTAHGGGVAEMLPALVFLLNELGIRTRWAVIQTERPEFFALTKRLHNLIHGDSNAGIDLGAEHAALFEEVNRANADSLEQHLGPNDVLVVHDPQPLPLGKLLHDRLGVPAIWRCHIGLDKRNAATAAAWSFLRPYIEGYAHSAFSAPEYIPSFLEGRVSVLHPGIDPLSHKNRELSINKIVGILCNSGLQTAYEPVPTPTWRKTAKRALPGGNLETPEELGLLFRPSILQVSRWDRLKGWAYLLEAFVRLKNNLRRGSAEGLSQRNQRRLELSRLILAGPDPSSVDDDPEGLEVFQDLVQRYTKLKPELQKDIAILVLPMESRKQNALIVNALQRCASVVVQNSIQEGFGLTVSEAMWKNVAVIGSGACGIRAQIRNGMDGILLKDPTNAEDLASQMFALIIDPKRRFDLGRSARRRVHDNFLIFDQLGRYLELLSQQLAPR